MNKEEALKIILDSAKSYSENFINCNLLFVACDKHKKVSFLETTFYSSNFLHLTGIEPSSKYFDKASMFFQDCLDNIVTVDDFNFDKEGQSHLKLQVLKAATSKGMSAKMYGEYNAFILHELLNTEKLIGNNNLCLGFVKAKESNNIYVPNTLLKKDIRDLTGSYKRIIATYKKSIKDVKYNEMVYLAKKTHLKDYTFPKEYNYLKQLDFFNC